MYTCINKYRNTVYCSIDQTKIAYNIVLTFDSLNWVMVGTHNFLWLCVITHYVVSCDWQKCVPTWSTIIHLQPQLITWRVVAQSCKKLCGPIITSLNLLYHFFPILRFWNAKQVIGFWKVFKFHYDWIASTLIMDDVV